jgi:hypothetical protein
MTRKEHLQKLAATTAAINATKKPGQRKRTMEEVAIKILEIGGGTQEERAFLAEFINEAIEDDTIAEYYEGE